MAPLPRGIRGHFGPELRRFVLMQYHQRQVTVERLVTLLRAVGVSISKRQVTLPRVAALGAIAAGLRLGPFLHAARLD